MKRQRRGGLVDGDNATVKRIYMDGQSVVLHLKNFGPDYKDSVIDPGNSDAPSVHFFGKIVSYAAPLDWRP